MDNLADRRLLGRLRTADWLLLDRVVAAAYAVPALLLSVNLASGVAGVVAVPIGVAVFGWPVAARRRHPVPALLVVLTGLGVVGFVEPRAMLLGLLPLGYVLYAVASATRPAIAVSGLGASVGAALATALPDFRHDGAAYLFAPLYVAIWLVGYLVGLHRRHTEDLLDWQAQIARVEVQLAGERVTQERLRIARELHDIVAHGMSVITVQAGYGHLVIDDDPTAARAALGAIESTGRQTLTEMRQLLTVLRDDSPGDPTASVPLAPAVGLNDLDVLLQQTMSAGLSVAMTTTGQPRPLPAGIDLSAYRIVQEALTNVIKHAQTSSASVHLDYRRDDLGIEIIDRGLGCRGAGAPVPGHGLVGMIERARAYGGSLHARPLDGRGFQVSCRIPLPADPFDDQLSDRAGRPV